MRIDFNTNYYNTFTKNVLYRNEIKNQSTLPDIKEEKDTFVIQDKNDENKTVEPCRSPITKNTVNKFVQFYYGLDEYSRDMIHYCLMDNEERYGTILDRIDKIEGKDRNTKKAKGLTRKFLDLMMLPEFYDSDARYEAEELAKLPAFEKGKNENVYKLLKELSNPPEFEEEIQTKDTAEADELEYIEDIDEDDPLFADDKINKAKENKTAKIGFFKKMAALFATAR